MKNNVSERIKAVRNRLGMSQTEFAVDLDSSVSLISKIESGDIEPSPKLLKRVCDKFGVDSDWLGQGKGELSASTKIKDINVNPWKDEAYKQLKQERDYFKDRYTKAIDAILSGNLGKLLALKSAGTRLRKVA